jgi:hypothetical protein
VVGRIAMGAFSDRFNPWLLALIMLSAASASVFIFWGILAHNLAGLILFGLTYGCIAGGWSSTWTGFLRLADIRIFVCHMLMACAAHLPRTIQRFRPHCSGFCF